MTMAEHTPGRWAVRAGAFIEIVADDGDDTPLATLHCRRLIHGDRANAIANGRMMAMAPDLLQACEDVLAYLDRPPEARWQYIDQATAALRATIAKARGA